MSFEWDEISSQEDFFAEVEKEEQTTAIDNDAEDNKEAKTEDKTEDQKKEETSSEEDLFASSGDDEDGEDSTDDDTSADEKPKTKKTKSNVDTVATVSFLQKKGLLNLDLDEEVEITEENAEEILEDSFENTIEERIAEKLQSLPGDAKNLIQYVLKGGSMQSYFSEVLDGNVDIDEDIDLTSEKNQEAVVRAVLEMEGEDLEDIEERIEYLKDKGTLASTSERKLQKYTAEKKKAEEQAIKAQAQAREVARKTERENRRKYSAFLSEQKEIGDLPIPRKAKTELPGFVYEKSVELENGGKITPMQKELFYELPKNEKAYTQLAILLQNRNSDGTFNFDLIAKKVETTVIKDVKDKVRRTNTTKGVSTTEVVRPTKSLSSYFDN